MSCRFILFSLLTLSASMVLSGCGQPGPLYLPHTPASAGRATLPQIVFGQKASPEQAPASAPQPSAAPDTQ
jgi:predicted small lipoprotein YifL